MSKRGREQNRQRRLIGENPGAGWTATAAAERAVRLRDDLAEKTPNNPVLVAIEAASLARGVRLKQRAFRAVENKIVAATDLYSVLANRPLAAIPTFPAEMREAYAAAVRHIPDAEGSPDAGRPDGIAARVAAANTARLVSTLHTGEVYVVSPALHQAICAAARTVSPGDLRTWRTEDVVADAGFLSFPYDQPIEVNGPGAEAGSLAGILWRRTPVYIPGEERWHPSIAINELATYDHTSPDGAARQRIARRYGSPLPRLDNRSSSVAYLDLSEDDTASLPEDYDERTQAARDIVMDNGAFESGQTGRHVAGEAVPDPLGDFSLRYLFCFMRLAEQRVATMSRPPAAHANGPRPPRSVEVEQVRVVHLRAADSQRPESIEPQKRSYQHRFVVGMHKVRQWYPSEGRHKVIWRGPFIKGPEGAPLLVGEKVRALVR